MPWQKVVVIAPRCGGGAGVGIGSRRRLGKRCPGRWMLELLPVSHGLGPPDVASCTSRHASSYDMLLSDIYRPPSFSAGAR